MVPNTQVDIYWTLPLESWLRTRLKSLNLTEDWPISPVLFNGDKPFPYLGVGAERAPITYDDRWYYTGNLTQI